MNQIKYPEQFAHNLVGWFRLHKRDLPFRIDKDPYRIFVSELMLQQTQIDTMIPYYERFMNRFPTVKALADASLDEVMELWAGLGYYRRARYLHESAQMIRDQHDGHFPSHLETIETLKGVGRYTARAIHSIAYGEPSPAVDGNVMRVMARILGYEKDIRKTKHMREIETVLVPIINQTDPGAFTEALMEIGALVCKKTNPLCSKCPLRTHCFAYKHNKQDGLPVVSKRASKREHHYYTFVVETNEGYLVPKRPETGLLAGMLAFPQFERTSCESAQTAFEETYGMVLGDVHDLGTIKHVFTHKIWHMRILYSKCPDATHEAIRSKHQLKTLPTAHKKILDLL